MSRLTNQDLFVLLLIVGGANGILIGAALALMLGGAA